MGVPLNVVQGWAQIYLPLPPNFKPLDSCPQMLPISHHTIVIHIYTYSLQLQFKLFPSHV